MFVNPLLSSLFFFSTKDEAEAGYYLQAYARTA